MRGKRKGDIAECHEVKAERIEGPGRPGGLLPPGDRPNAIEAIPVYNQMSYQHVDAYFTLLGVEELQSVWPCVRASAAAGSPHLAATAAAGSPHLKATAFRNRLHRKAALSKKQRRPLEAREW